VKIGGKKSKKEKSVTFYWLEIYTNEMNKTRMTRNDQHRT